ncbi:alpha-tubulin N-acetyltransferase 1-like isoform X2 [Plodia interpunctella]|uniref:alpha-tubulin N-acetyltransferase 1-like isoform X2 n=1 Tax=Plodia interpunctella TaxID=58824 RepID=UPI0023679F89|nr:alpha-tubulin N-acetyltransferase 1-like isoform X2 [Plodia interpunctella]
MEWIVPVNEMLQDEITKLNYTLIPPGYQGDVRSVRVVQESLSKLINQLGEQSAAAQGLNKVITTAEKLQKSPSYSLYLLKDADAKGGAGEVIGLLKVGRKHLFLFDDRDKVCEVEPLCVLDFFVSHDRQRRGYGRMLFDHMLREAGARPQQLAIDGPSPKMEKFLAKNYGVDRLIRQNNNFAVAPSFFDSLRDVRLSLRQILDNKKKRTELAGTEIGKAETAAVAPAAVGRFAAPKPHSAIANVIHGGDGGGFFHDTSNGGSRATTPATAPAPASSAPEPEPAPEPLPEPAANPSRPSSLRVEPASTATRPRLSAPSPAPSPAAAGRRDSQLTELGYFDVKFYHNKLW